MRYIAEVDKTKKTYFVAAPIFYTEHDDIIEWLESTSGQGFSLHWPHDKVDGISQNRGIHFYAEQDAVMYLLRWS